MNLTKLNAQSSSSDWNKKWEDIFIKYQQDVRHAHYIRAILRRDEKKILEIGAGSFRDMAFLCSKGINCDGFDFSETSVNMARIRYPDLKEKISVNNAFNTEIEDNTFDLTYHNGFFSCFNQKEIEHLIKEQARITRKRVVATVHNAHNKDFMNYFDRMKQDDPLFEANFFTIEEMLQLMQPYCRSVKIIPVGKGKKKHEDWLIKNHITNPLIIRSYLQASRKSFIATSERLLCIGEL